MFRTMLLITGALAAAAGWITPTFATHPASARPAATTQAVHVIVLDKMAFGPMPSGVRAGDIIEWVNHDIFEHTATARDGSFDIDLKSGATVRTTAKIGSFAFYCKFHPGMTGTLVAK